MSKRKKAPFTVQERGATYETRLDSGLQTNMRSSMRQAGRCQPNLLICGTPGTGKSALCQALLCRLNGRRQDEVEGRGVASAVPTFRYFSISQLVQEKGWIEGRDSVLDTLVIHEKKLLRGLWPEIQQGGCLIDFHGCDLFPSDWLDLVIVLCTNNTILYDRLAQRQYAPLKISENIECEIMQVILEEARAAFPLTHLVLTSDSREQLEANAQSIYNLLS